MSMENLGPYSNFHELNLDWFLNEFNKVLEQWKAMQKNFDNLQDAFNDLKNYVQDYFKNLDVTEEINNKLDSMVDDGSLTRIFAPYLNNINSPIIVDSVIKMTDKNKIYLLSSNSHLYTWNKNESSFTDSGIIYGSFNSQFIYDNYSNIASHDFNDFTNSGGYWVTITEEQSDAVNAPFDLKFGNFVVNNLSFPVNDELWFMQIVSIDKTAVTNKTYDKTVAYRWFNPQTKESTTGWRTLQSIFDYNNMRNIASHNFNDFTNSGGYWVTITEEQSDAVNAPFDLKFGNFVVNNLSFPVNDELWFMQIVSIDKTNIYDKSVAFRWFNPETKESTTGWRGIDCFTNISNSMYLIGDSITAGHPFENKDYVRWFSPLKDIYKIDVGVRSGSGLLYKNNDINGISICDSHDFSENDFVCIFMGTNDYGNNMNLGEVEDMYPTNETVCGALNYMLNKIKKDNGGCAIIGILPLNRINGNFNNNYAYGTVNASNYTLKELNDKLTIIYEKYCCCVINNEYSPINKYSLNSLLIDGLHPNIIGYRHLSQWLNGHIRSLFNKTNF